MAKDKVDLSPITNSITSLNKSMTGLKEFVKASSKNQSIQNEQINTLLQTVIAKQFEMSAVLESILQNSTATGTGSVLVEEFPV